MRGFGGGGFSFSCLGSFLELGRLVDFIKSIKMFFFAWKGLRVSCDGFCTTRPCPLVNPNVNMPLECCIRIYLRAWIPELNNDTDLRNRGLRSRSTGVGHGGTNEIW